MEQKLQGKLPADTHISDHYFSSSMVAQEREPGSPSIHCLSTMRNPDNERKPDGVGSTPRTISDTGEVDALRKQKILQLEGTEGCSPDNPALPKTPQVEIHSDKISQFNHSKLLKQPGRNQMQTIIN